ncbi:hypothetical protein IGI04_036121, partial [Brassica rapa subsp. trilocularis]
FCSHLEHTKCARSETVWKEKWRYQGDAAKSTFISKTTWIGLKAYWNFPRSVRRSYNCAVAQLTSDAEGNLPLPHTSEKVSHTGVSLNMAAEEGEAPSLSLLYKKTHQLLKDGHNAPWEGLHS